MCLSFSSAEEGKETIRVYVISKSKESSQTAACTWEFVKNADPDSGGGTRFCISNQLSGDTDATGLRTTL